MPMDIPAAHCLSGEAVNAVAHCEGGSQTQLFPSLLLELLAGHEN